MARVTATEVKQIIDTSLEDTVVDAYIAAANPTITEALSGSGLTDAHIKEIERWYCAHLIAATREQQPISEGAGGASITYQGQTGLGLESTFYGQQVLSIDTSGNMALLYSKRRASIYAIPNFD